MGVFSERVAGSAGTASGALSFLGGLYSLAYVLGMVAPLFIISYFADKTDAVKRMQKMNRRIDYNVLGKDVSIRFSEVVVAAMFIAMGLLTIYLALTGQLQQMSAGKLETNIFMAGVTQWLQQNLSWAPDYAVVGLILITGGLVVYLARGKTRENGKREN